MRWIDDVIKVIVEHPYISATHKQVLITRVEKSPTEKELEAAREKLEKENVDGN